jgi:hypothetical protein
MGSKFDCNAERFSTAQMFRLIPVTLTSPVFKKAIDHGNVPRPPVVGRGSTGAGYQFSVNSAFGVAVWRIYQVCGFRPSVATRYCATAVPAFLRQYTPDDPVEMFLVIGRHDDPSGKLVYRRRGEDTFYRQDPDQHPNAERWDMALCGYFIALTRVYEEIVERAKAMVSEEVAYDRPPAHAG